MFIFLAIAMGPACWFMLYALSQFWREAMRLRHANSNHLTGPVTVITATAGLDEENPGRAWGTPDGPASPEVMELASSDERPTHGKVLTTYLKSRLTVLPSGTGRLAVKRVAKGSS
ncbi:MAG TPA: hypothetical protein VN822_08300 [Candidatus Acidoferrales bacterium]|nr:hypothetical protein [Candidatus Acidoferrales bacterium]